MTADDVVREAERLMAAANQARVKARVVGGVAVALHAPSGLPEPLQRPYRDLDLVAAPKSGRATLRFLVEMGYESNERFNAMNGHERLVVYDVKHGRQVDVFVGSFHMCHRIPIANRLDLDPKTVPLAELVLTKLQVVRLNEKDLKDIYGLLLEHEIGDNDDDTINAPYVAKLLAADWGLWRTAQATLETARTRLPASGLDGSQTATVSRRIDELWEVVEGAPKSVKWRARARVGDRIRWYEEPEEIDHRMQVEPQPVDRASGR